tara:strand:- start:43 stop:312 length:270 start_codon:yes stop_codon:yes gene_type:complete
MRLQNKHDRDDRWIYERNPDTGEIKKRNSGEYGNEQIVNPAVNSVPNFDDGVCEGEYIRPALNMSGQEWIDFIDSLTPQQKIQLSRCWD